MHVIALSNCLEINSSECFTKTVKYKDAKNSFGFNYLLDPTFYQQVRLHLAIQNFKYPTKEKVYREMGGKFRYGNVIIDKSYDLITDQIDEDTADALMSTLKHSDLYIDDIKYSCQGTLDLTDNEFNNLQSGKAILFKQEYNETNQQC